MANTGAPRDGRVRHRLVQRPSCRQFKQSAALMAVTNGANGFGALDVDVPHLMVYGPGSITEVRLPGDLRFERPSSPRRTTQCWTGRPMSQPGDVRSQPDGGFQVASVIRWNCDQPRAYSPEKRKRGQVKGASPSRRANSPARERRAEYDPRWTMRPLFKT